MNDCSSTGKEMFATFAAAYKRVSQLSKRKKDRHDDKFNHGPLSAYRCRHCHQLHVGHKTTTANVKRKAA